MLAILMLAQFVVLQLPKLPAQTAIGVAIRQIQLGIGDDKDHEEDEEREDGPEACPRRHGVCKTAGRCIDEGADASDKSHYAREASERGEREGRQERGGQTGKNKKRKQPLAFLGGTSQTRNSDYRQSITKAERNRSDPANKEGQERRMRPGGGTGSSKGRGSDRDGHGARMRWIEE